MGIFVPKPSWKRNYAGPRVLSQRRGVLSDGNMKWAVFLFNLSSHCYIYIDKFANLGETNVLAREIFTSCFRPWLKQDIWPNLTGDQFFWLDLYCTIRQLPRTDTLLFQGASALSIYTSLISYKFRVSFHWNDFGQRPAPDSPWFERLRRMKKCSNY